MTLRIPRVAVVLPVYNCETYVGEAIQSVLSQTYDDFVLIAIDDGSTDRTLQILNSFTDTRLQIIRLPIHQGLVSALNIGLGEAKSEFIARMDADDICMPQRFARQVQFLDAHPDISLCGTWMREFGACDYLSRPKTEPEQVRAGLFFGWVISHPTIMLRRSALQHFGLTYREEFPHVEDLDFLIRASEVTRLANIPEYLVHYRKHDRQVTVVYRDRQLQALGMLLVRQLRRLIPEVSEEEAAFHIDLAHAALPPSRLRQAQDWLLRLERANIDQARYDVESFRLGLSQWWYSAHATQAVLGGVSVLKSYWNSPLARVQDIGWYSQVSLAAKCILRRPSPRT